MAPTAARSEPLVRRVRLDNGLDLVLSPDRSSPTVAVGVYFRAGFRLEPEGRTGFAHLFEHLMFQGTADLPKPNFSRIVGASGGVLNGSTRHDYTNFYEVLPSSALEAACFLEADRLQHLDLNQENLENQVAVVEEEVRTNVLNRPFGGFSWLWLSQYAFSTYPNNHNFYGEFADLEAATLEEARAFYETWYGPGNASLILVGDFDPDEAVELVQRHFGKVPGRPEPPQAHFDEPSPLERKEERRTDPLAPSPKLAVGYRTAPFGHPDHLPLALAARILSDGRSSRLQRRLVGELRLLLQVGGGPNYGIGDSFDFKGPALFTLEATPSPGVSTETALRALDEELARFASDGPSPDELLRAKRRELAAYHAGADSRLGRMGHLGALAAVHDRPELVDELPVRFEAVTEAEVRSAVSAWLRPDGSTVLHWLPRDKAARR